MWELVRWLHLVAMAFFVGGQLFLAVAVVPVLRGEGERQRLRLIARRFGYGTLGAIAVLIASGTAMAAHFHRWDNGDLQAKLGLVAVVTVLVLWHIRRPANHVLDGLIFVGSLAIVWLGVAVAH